MTAVTVIKAVGIQSVIAETNRLRLLVGTSALVRELTIDRVGDAARKLNDVEAVRSSGQAVLVGPREHNLQVVREVTTAAFEDAPGIEIAGATVELDPDRHADLGHALAAAMSQLEVSRGELRFGRRAGRLLPPLQRCAQTPYAAGVSARFDEALSAAAVARLDAADRAYGRFRKRVSDLPEDLGGLEDRLDTSWLGVVRVDGDRLGELFVGLGPLLRAADRSDEYLDHYRQLSDEVRDIVDGAVFDTINDLGVPVLPLIVGGDDVTLVCRGQDARAVTAGVLSRFESTPAVDGILAALLKRQGRGHLTASAGIAVVSPHFPFHLTYEMASDLLERTKHVRADGAPTTGAFDLTVHYQTTRPVHMAPTAPDGLRLHGGPYTLQPRRPLTSATDLERTVETITDRDDDGRRTIPSRLLTDATRALAGGRDAAKRWQQDLRPDARQAIERLSNTMSPDADDRLHASGRTLLFDARAIADVEDPAP